MKDKVPSISFEKKNDKNPKGLQTHKQRNYTVKFAMVCKSDNSPLKSFFFFKTNQTVYSINPSVCVSVTRLSCLRYVEFDGFCCDIH